MIGDRQPSRKIIQNNDNEDDPGSQKRVDTKIEKMREMFTRDLKELKSRQIEMSNTLEGISIRITEAEEWIKDLEDRVVEITATEQNIEKRKKRNEESLRELWDNVKYTNIHIIGVPKEKREKGSEKILKEIIAENFLSMGKEIAKPRKHRVSQVG